MREHGPNWKGGKTRNDQGRILVYKPNHPHALPNGYVYESRLVMEQHLGRYLNPTEVVHHINDIKDDNRIKNLIVLSNSEHISLHTKGKRNPSWSGGPTRTCPECGELMDRRSSRCLECLPKLIRKKVHVKDNKICPECGNPMNYRSSMCKKCYLKLKRGKNK